MEKPHIPTLQELEALFAEDTTPLTYRAPPNPSRLQQELEALFASARHAHSTHCLTIGEPMKKPHIPTLTAVRAFISAWDDDLTVRQLAPFVEEMRRALEGRP